jgi:mRNA-degrading endonuclease RelE of RelBE toxin-antitoxin system
VDTKYKIIYTEQIFDDLESIPSKPALTIIDQIDRLEHFPEMGSTVQSKKWKGYRHLIIKDHIVFYIVNHKNKIVVIKFIKHGRMNLY